MRRRRCGNPRITVLLKSSPGNQAGIHTPPSSGTGIDRGPEWATAIVLRLDADPSVDDFERHFNFERTVQGLGYCAGVMFL